MDGRRIVFALQRLRQTYKSQDIPGHYVLDLGMARDELDVFPNGQYLQSYLVPRNQPITHQGTWYLDTEERAQFVIFDEFRRRNTRDDSLFRELAVRDSVVSARTWSYPYSMWEAFYGVYAIVPSNGQ